MEPDSVEMRKQTLRILVHERQQAEGAQAPLPMYGALLNSFNNQTCSAQRLCQHQPLIASPENGQVNFTDAARKHAQQTEHIESLWLCLAHMQRRGVHTDFQRLGWVQLMHILHEVF